MIGYHVPIILTIKNIPFYKNLTKKVIITKRKATNIIRVGQIFSLKNTLLSNSRPIKKR